MLEVKTVARLAFFTKHVLKRFFNSAIFHSIIVEVEKALQYFIFQVKPPNHSHKLPPPGKKGRTYICSCMLFIRPTNGGKLILRKWIEELEAQPWSQHAKANDQPAFNWALNKTADMVFYRLITI